MMVWTRRLRTALATATLAAVATVPARAHAQSAGHLWDEPVTPRQMALGGRAEALGTSTSAMFGNPAGLGGSPTFHTDAYALYDPSTSRFSSGSAVVDSTRSVVTGGTAYIYNTQDGATAGHHREHHDWRINLGLSLARNVFSLGLTLHYLNTSETPPAYEHSTLTGGPDGWAGFTFDAGVYFKPVQWLALSASGHNLTNPNTTAAPIYMDTGLAFTPAPFFSLVADALVDFRTRDVIRGRYSGGIELFIADHVLVRGGYMYDHVRDGAQFVTFGAGYVMTNFGIELSMRQGVVPEPQSNVLPSTVMASLRYFYTPPQ